MTKILYAHQLKQPVVQVIAGCIIIKTTITGSGSDYAKEYCNGIEYNNGSLEAIYFSEGRLVPDGVGWTYEYTLTDHLGNNRVTMIG